jgi:TonB family protein
MKLHITLILALATVFSSAQDIAFTRFQNVDVEFTERIDLSNLNKQQYFIQTPYASSVFMNPHLIESVKGLQTTEIMLVYSDFQRAESFSQHGLNAKRAENLYQVFPDAFEDQTVDFRLVAQTGCHNVESCGELPHGFIITTRASQSSDNIDELKFLKDVTEMRHLAIYSELVAADGKVVPYLLDRDAYFPGGPVGFTTFLSEHVEFPERASERGLTAQVRIEFKVNNEGQLFDTQIQGTSGSGFISAVQEALSHMPLWAPAVRKGEQVTSQQKVRVLFQYDEEGQPEVSILTHHHSHPLANLEDMMDEYRSFQTDSVVLRTLDRLQGANASVVMDVTGSMSPYNAQLLLWLKLNENMGDFVLFNDGDNKSNLAKEIGDTRGIYRLADATFEELMETTMEAMLNGTGGDIEENALEAILDAQQTFDAESIIWIADNHSTPRDMELLEKVSTPVRVIVCGGLEGINTSLLDVARNTRGSIHLMEQDLFSLASLKEGESVEIHGFTYVIKGGKFVWDK